jgi:hypothetical protein
MVIRPGASGNTELTTSQVSKEYGPNAFSAEL